MRRMMKKLRGAPIKLYLGIALACFIIAGLLHLAIEKGSDEVTELEAWGTGARSSMKNLKASLRENLKEAEIDKAKEVYRGVVENQSLDRPGYNAGPINAEELEEIKKALKSKLNAQEIERLKKAYRDSKESE